MHPRMMPIITALACTNGDVGYGEPCWDFSMEMMCDAVVLTLVKFLFEFTSPDIAQSRCS